MSKQFEKRLSDIDADLGNFVSRKINLFDAMSNNDMSPCKTCDHSGICKFEEDVTASCNLVKETLGMIIGDVISDIYINCKHYKNSTNLGSLASVGPGVRMHVHDTPFDTLTPRYPKFNTGTGESTVTNPCDLSSLSRDEVVNKTNEYINNNRQIESVGVTTENGEHRSITTKRIGLDLKPRSENPHATVTVDSDKAFGALNAMLEHSGIEGNVSSNIYNDAVPKTGSGFSGQLVMNSESVVEDIDRTSIIPSMTISTTLGVDNTTREEVPGTTTNVK